MVFKGKISPEIRALAVCLREKHGESYPEIGKRCKISVSSAERICKTSLSLYSNSKAAQWEENGPTKKGFRPLQTIASSEFGKS